MSGAVPTIPLDVFRTCGGGGMERELHFFKFEFQTSNDPACADTFTRTCKFHAANG
jgi:hypothetical protein